MSKDVLKNALRDSKKDNLKKEIKDTKLSAKDKELQVIYEEIEYIVKESVEWEEVDNAAPLDPKKEDELNKRYHAVIQYVSDNFSEDFLENSKVRPGPLFNEYIGSDIVDFIEFGLREEAIENVRLSTLSGSSLVRDIDSKRVKQENVFRKNAERIKLSPYTQRLQDMVKERLGR